MRAVASSTVIPQIGSLVTDLVSFMVMFLVRVKSHAVAASLTFEFCGNTDALAGAGVDGSSGLAGTPFLPD